MDVIGEDQEELNHLEQVPLIRSARKWGIEIPWEPSSLPRSAFPNVSYKGEAWLRHEIGERRRTWAKDWAAIISPLLSFLVAILSLLVALKKR